jgi:hypothetical protein
MTISQQFGVLTTGLNEALAAARGVLEPHADLLPEGRIAELGELLEEFARRRIRVAVYGEVKAGKSSLVNAMAGSELSPVAFEPITSIPVRITYGSSTVWRVGADTVESIDKLSELMRGEIRAEEVVVETDLDLLQLGGQVDVLDTPGVASDERFDSISAQALRSLDAVVLVVRYPALFTQLTRTLMRKLEADISKLFVVWNLDGACTDLTPEERDRHTETLRENVVGAHELYRVDARAGLAVAGAEASGLAEFRAALGRFASSEKREVVALREVAKRAGRWLDEAQEAFGERKQVLDSLLGDARDRVQDVQNEDDTRAATARTALAELKKSVAGIAEQREKEAADSAAKLRKQMRKARRAWMRKGDFDTLDTAVKEATGAYADAVESVSRTALKAVRDAARSFGAEATGAPRERRVPSVDVLAPDERKQRAAEGSGKLLRRVLRRRWYLPGLTTLERETVDGDLASQATWFDAEARRVDNAARAVLDERLTEIHRQAGAETARIKAEVDFEASETEFEALSQHLPTLTVQRDRAASINDEARSLMK